MKTARRGIVFSLLPLALIAGCASPPAPSTDVSVDTGGSARFVLPAARANNLNASNAAEVFSKVAANASRYGGMSGVYGSRQGLSLRSEGSRLTVGYINTSGQPLNRTHNQIATFDIEFSTQGRDKVLNVRCPTQLRVEFNNGTGLGSFPPFATREAVISDLRAMCKSSSFTYPDWESGEFNVAFGDSAVYANFARKLSAHAWRGDSVTQNDIAKYKWFTLSDAGVNVPVGITVYPYRNGSKVTYRWSSNYVCSGDGRCAYAIDAKRVHELLNAIAND